MPLNPEWVLGSQEPPGAVHYMFQIGDVGGGNWGVTPGDGNWYIDENTPVAAIAYNMAVDPPAKTGQSAQYKFPFATPSTYIKLTWTETTTITRTPGWVDAGDGNPAHVVPAPAVTTTTVAQKQFVFNGPPPAGFNPTDNESAGGLNTWASTGLIEIIAPDPGAPPAVPAGKFNVGENPVSEADVTMDVDSVQWSFLPDWFPPSFPADAPDGGFQGGPSGFPQA